MLKESGRFHNPVNQDLNNEDYLRSIFESGDEAMLAKVADHHKLTPEQIELFTHFSQLRRATINETRTQAELRGQKHPLATEAEKDMGAYLENIEPQVRETVINLREHGYTTYESGFSGFDSQVISFQEDHLHDFHLPEAVRDDFEKRGVVVKIEPNSLRLTFKKKVNLEEIKKVWQEIASYLPKFGSPAKPSQLKQSNSFREKQKSNYGL